MERRWSSAPVRLALVVTLAACCGRAPTDPVGVLLSELEAVATLRRYFAAYESVRVEVYGVEAEREERRARVRCVVEFSGAARRLPGFERLLPPSAAYRFELDLADENGAWLLRAAAWEEARPRT